MPEIIVEGGSPLKGDITLSGAKNSALKIIAAALFSNEDIELENVPRMQNVLEDLEIIESLGGKVEWLGENRLLINGSGIFSFEIPWELGSKNRTAGLHAAALLHRFGKAVLPIPGGCRIGFRPVNRWIEAWRALGIEVTETDKYYSLESKDLCGGNISFKVSTHMGTDMAILFSIFAPGETIITNAAEEPEVDDLITFVNKIGAQVERVEPRKIKIIGKDQFKGCSYKVLSDRNEAVTFAVGALVTKGNITIHGVQKENLLAFTNLLSKIGCRFEFSGEEMRVWTAGESFNPVNVTTSAHPGVMTDWQPFITLLLTQAEGESLVHETIYTDRFGYTNDLNRMGAKIELLKPSDVGLEAVVSDDSYAMEKMGEPLTVARIKGPSKLRGERLIIPDLRAGVTLILAALAAEGKSEIDGYGHVSRGYENFLGKIANLGATITQAS